MKKFLYIFTAWLIGGMMTGFAQPLDKNIKEQVQVHLSNSSLITGETLYYSANVVSSKTHEFADLSSILYVEIINEKHEPVHQSKIRIDQGQGYGDFFVSSLVPTGNYQLIAYTRWMKNFGEYFHHPLHIINPFEIYQPPAKTEKLSVSFYPEGGQIVADTENTLVVEVTDYMGKYTAFSGRIVDEEGNVINNVNSTVQGLAKTIYTPEVGVKYQLILEDLGGNFQFINLPVALENQYTIQVTNQENSFLVNVLGPKKESLLLKAYKGSDIVYEMQITTNSQIQISRRTLGVGVTLLKLFRAGESISERLVYEFSDETNAEAQNIDKAFNKRTFVSLPISVEEGSKISISVRKVHDYTTTNLSLKAGQLLYGVKELHRYRNEFLFDRKNRELIDLLMISSSWKYDTSIEREIQLLPDHRGEIISGVMPKPDSLKTQDLMVGYSIIGQNYQVKMAKVNTEGKFTTVIHPFEGDQVAYITSMDGLNAEEIILDQPFMTEYPELSFQGIILDTTSIQKIVARSVRNQIENAYFEVKADSISHQPAYPEEFSEFEYFYVLDDYNRFPTIRDAFVEYIPTVGVRTKNDVSELRVIPKYLLAKPILPSQAFLDGLPVTPDEILKFSPYRIESIGVLNNRYFMGPRVIDGIVSFRTKEGDLQGFTPGLQSKEVEYMGITPKKIYSFPIHQNSALGEANLESRIPDFRDQLFWNPEVEISAGDPYSIEFFTSDTPGEFEVAVEGVTKEGKTISFRNYFTIE